MRIIAINGSHKKTGGINQLFIDEIFKGAKSAGAECETVRLSDKTVYSCKSCGYCQKQEGYACVLDGKDDFKKIIEKITIADLVIYSTPVYIMNISGLMKNFLDRLYSQGKSQIKKITKTGLLFHDVNESLLNKPFVSIIISDNIEYKTTKCAKDYFDVFSEFFGAPHAGSIVRNGAFIFKDGNNIESEGIKNKILEHLKKAGESLATAQYISKKDERVINKNIIPIPKLFFQILKRTKKGQEILLKNIS